MIKTIEQLLASHCRGANVAAMNRADVAAQLAALDQWAFDAGALKKIYRFSNYYETLAFVNAVAYMVHRGRPSSGLAGWLRSLRSPLQHTLGQRHFRKRLHLCRQGRCHLLAAA